MSVDAALKYIISMGVLAPPGRLHRAPDSRPDNPTLARPPVRGAANTRPWPCELDYCGLSDRSPDLGQTVTLCGWVAIAAATTAASSSSTCATAKAWCRWCATPTAPRCSRWPKSVRNEFCADRSSGKVRARPAGTDQRQPDLGRDRDAVPRHSKCSTPPPPRRSRSTTKTCPKPCA